MHIAKLSGTIKYLAALFLALIILMGVLIWVRDPWKQRISQKATDAVITEIERGYSSFTLTALPPEIDGEDEDWAALEGLEKILGQTFDKSDVAEAERLAAENKIVALGTLEISKISLKLPIIEGTGKVGMRIGAGWFKTSARLGQPGNCLLFGHRMNVKGRLFNRFYDDAKTGEVALKKGDIVNTVDLEGNLYVYKVLNTITVKPEDLFEELYKYTNGRYLSLITCTPNRAQRLIVLCEILEN